MTTYFLIRMTNTEGTWWYQGENRWCDTTGDALACASEAEAHSAIAAIPQPTGSMWDWQPHNRFKIIRFVVRK